MGNKIFYGILAILIGGVVFVVATKKSDTPARSEITIENLKEYDNLERKHEEGPINYPQSPPVGGNHNPLWVPCDQKSYDEPVRSEMAVHSLEHGAVWITYATSLEQEKIDQLKEKVKTSGSTFLSPYPEQTAPIILTAWGKQIEVTDVNDPRIDQFLTKFRKSPHVPEPGATCSSPQG